MNTGDLRNLIIRSKRDAIRSREMDSIMSLIIDYENGLKNHYFDLDFVKNFFNKYVFGEMPSCLIPLIFDQVKKYTGIDIPPYNRFERTDKSLIILKSCMIYHEVYEHFKNFAFVLNTNALNIVEITHDQDIPNETLEIPYELKIGILTKWNMIATDPEPFLIYASILKGLYRLNDRIYGVIMFEFRNLIFIIPVKKIKLTAKVTYKIIDIKPIPIPKTQPPPQIPPQRPQYILPQSAFPPQYNPFPTPQFNPIPPPPQYQLPPQYQPPPQFPPPEQYQPPSIIQPLQPPPQQYQPPPDLF